MADDDAQPDEGQGGSDAPYADYLERFDEASRPVAEEVFKEWDGNVTKRFQAASEAAKEWEPFAETGVKDLSPDMVSWLVQFAQAQQENPQAVVQWAQEFAQANGLTESQQAALEDNPEVQALLEQQLSQHMTPVQQEIAQLREWQAQQEEQAANQRGQQMVDAQVADLKAKHPNDLPMDEKGNVDMGLIERFAMSYVESDPQNAIAKGFADYRKIVDGAQKAQFEEKDRIGRMPAAESGGVADTSPEKINGLKEAGTIATEMIREMNRQNR